MAAVTRLAKAAAATISQATGILITCGAGFGVDSGLPDFRGKEGLWRAYPPIAERGLKFEEIADPHWFVE
jgi:NAD-dependent SIR2 family protein deacetylase